MSEHHVLLTVSGSIPDDLDADVRNGMRPRADYRVLAEALGADLLDVDSARGSSGTLGRALERLGGVGVLLAFEAFRRRRRYRVIVTDGEQVGLPYAAFCRLVPRRRPTHLMIVHILSVRKKEWLFKALRLGSRIDTMFVYATRQRELIADRLGYPLEQILLTPFQVDTTFFAPRAATVNERPLICSAGLEFRDYPTLVTAVEGLDARVVLAAASPWSKRRDNTSDVALPAHVEVDRLDLFQLRELYNAADLVVVPLLQTDFQAGITTILEAMAMGKPVICTKTLGQSDTIIDGVTGIYVPPGDPPVLRAAIDRLLSQREEAERLGTEARAWVRAHADVEVYASGLARSVLAAARGHDDQ